MFGSISLMPHSVCWKADPQLIWTMVVTNAVTFLSYVTICVTLLMLSRRTRRVIARDWAYFAVGFALFIVACGSTHLLEVITTWKPIFWVDAWTNIVTAVLSAWVAVNLVRRSGAIGFGINDYAARLSNTELEKQRIEDSLLAAHRLEEWSRMSAVLAHEISTPVESIQNLLYLIRSTDVSPEVAEYALAAEEEAARVVQISRSTLSFFRQTAEPEMVDLESAAESVRLLVSSMLEKKEIHLEVVRAGNVAVRAYPGEVRQVLLNLVRNACEATERPGSRIEVQLRQVAHGVEMAVSDQGEGIDSSLLPNLFQFGASTKGEQGNGMGLWTVRHILGRHGGSIRVESKVGTGTRFVLFWPGDAVRASSRDSVASLRAATA